MPGLANGGGGNPMHLRRGRSVSGNRAAHAAHLAMRRKRPVARAVAIDMGPRGDVVPLILTRHAIHVVADVTHAAMRAEIVAQQGLSVV